MRGGKETAPPSVITCSAGGEPHREADGAGKLQLCVKGRLESLEKNQALIIIIIITLCNTTTQP